MNVQLVCFYCFAFFFPAAFELVINVTINSISNKFLTAVIPDLFVSSVPCGVTCFVCFVSSICFNAWNFFFSA